MLMIWRTGIAIFSAMLSKMAGRAIADSGEKPLRLANMEISERVKLGLQRVVKQGKILGRPKTVTSGLKDKVCILLNEGKSYSYINQLLGTPKSTISRIKNERV